MIRAGAYWEVIVNCHGLWNLGERENTALVVVFFPSSSRLSRACLKTSIFLRTRHANVNTQTESVTS